MRIVGLRFTSQAGPLDDGFFACGDLTVLIGPNDSGKTRVLRGLEAALTDTDFSEAGGTITVYAVELSDYRLQDAEADDLPPANSVSSALSAELDVDLAAHVRSTPPRPPASRSRLTSHSKPAAPRRA